LVAEHRSRNSIRHLDAVETFVGDLGDDFTPDPGGRGRQPVLGLLRKSAGLPIAAYAWRATAPFERQVGAHKIQITVPGLAPGERVHVFEEPGRFVVFAGLSEAFGTWTLWDAGLLVSDEGISWSRNLQVAADALSEAVRVGVATTTKAMRETNIGAARMTIVSCRRTLLAAGIAERFRLSLERQLGQAH
jgi:hypothetical protein